MGLGKVSSLVCTELDGPQKPAPRLLAVRKSTKLPDRRTRLDRRELHDVRDPPHRGSLTAVSSKLR